MQIIFLDRKTGYVIMKKIIGNECYLFLISYYIYFKQYIYIYKLHINIITNWWFTGRCEQHGMLVDIPV